MALLDPGPRNTFPSDGKVLVVGMDVPITMHSKFMNRAYFWGTEQLIRGQAYPPKVAAMILSNDLIPGDERRIKEIAEQRGIHPVARASGLVRLEELLSDFLRGVDLSVDPAPQEKALPSPHLTQKPVLHLVTKSTELEDEEQMPPADLGEVQTSLGYFWIPIGRIRIFKGQPREFFDQVSLALLAASISEGGQEEPIWVRRLTDDPNHDYELVDGQRRYHACAMVHFTHMKAVFKRPKTKIQQYKLSVIGNFGQEPHPPLEIARSIDKLARELPELKGLSLSKKMDALSHFYVKSPAWVAYHLSLLKLAPEVQAMMEANVLKVRRLPVVMGSYLSTIEDKSLQIEIAKLVVERGLSVKGARDYARRRASEIGTTIGAGRKRQPKDDYTILDRFVRRTVAEADIQAEIPAEYFGAMFKPRTEAERKSMSARLEHGVRALTQLKAKVDAL